MQDSLRELIRRRRAEMKMTQNALGEAAGCDGRHISKIETGEKGAAWDTMLNILEALHCRFTVWVIPVSEIEGFEEEQG